MYLEITICDIQSVSSEVTICVLKIYIFKVTNWDLERLE